jgi:hypothetical protein
MVELFIYVLEADCGEITGIIDPSIVLTPSSLYFLPSPAIENLGFFYNTGWTGARGEANKRSENELKV